MIILFIPIIMDLMEKRMTMKFEERAISRIMACASTIHGWEGS